MPAEFVERKGIGHPDTIADALANAFSRGYARYCTTTFGGVPRHSVDKLVLAGGTADLTFGNGEAISPIACHIFGKLTPRFDGQEIPTHDIAKQAYEEVIQLAFNSAAVAQLKPVTLHIDTNDGIGAEHPTHYYAPSLADHLDRRDGPYDANDSALIFGSSNPTDLERLVWAVERQTTAIDLQRQFGVGTDVKVLGYCSDDSLKLQLAVPFVAAYVSSENDYEDRLTEIERLVRVLVRESALSHLEVELRINTKDRPGHGYLTLAGSSLDKGDQGAVGRGNHYSGVISMLRPNSMESHSGKNPFRSPGRLYPVLCARLSTEFSQARGEPIAVGLQSANGRPLHEPEACYLLSENTGKISMSHTAVMNEDMLAMARDTVLSEGQLTEDLFGRIGNAVP